MLRPLRWIAWVKRFPVGATAQCGTMIAVILLLIVMLQDRRRIETLVQANSLYIRNLQTDFAQTLKALDDPDFLERFDRVANQLDAIHEIMEPGIYIRQDQPDTAYVIEGGGE